MHHSKKSPSSRIRIIIHLCCYESSSTASLAKKTAGGSNQDIALVLEDGNSVSDLEAPFASLDCS